MPLALLAGPANAGKVASLLDRLAAALERRPFLVVPNRGDVERIERDLLSRLPVLLGARIGTFDDLFEEIAGRAGEPAVAGATQRSLALWSAVRAAPLTVLSGSSRFGGFADALGEAVAELGSALVDPSDLRGDLAALYREYRAALERIGVCDREELRRRALDLVESHLAGWDGSPVLIYGFEDLTGAQAALVRALAGRCDVVFSLPYEPGRAAFEALGRTADELAGLAAGRIEELAPQGWYEAPALAHLERTLFTDAEVPPPRLHGAVRFLEASGTRAAFELVGDEILSLLREGVPAEEIAVVLPAIETLRSPLETTFGSLGIPYAVEGALRVHRTPLGRALFGLLRFAWLNGSRASLFDYLRSPYSGLARARIDFVEGRLRGRAVSEPSRVEEETVRLLGHRLEALDRLRETASPVEAVRELARSMLAAAWGLDHAPVDVSVQLDLSTEEAVRRTLDELDGWSALAGEVSQDQVVRALERTHVTTSARDPGRVAVLDLLRVRTRRFAVVFVLGLEDGSLPRRAAETPLLGDELREELARHGHPWLARPDAIARDRYLFYTACTRPWRRLYLVREAASDDGRPLEASPFWEEVRSRFAPAEVEEWTRRRPLSALAWELHRAPTERERLRAVAALASSDRETARTLAAAYGWSRQLERALAAFERPTKLVNPLVLRELQATARFSATDLEKFGDCSSMWFIERLISPREIDPEIDARLRGTVAHQALYRFYAGLPKRLGTDTVDRGRLDEALELLHECLDEAIAGQMRLELPEVDVLEVRGALARDLEQFVRREVELGLPLVPRRFEVSFGNERAAPELQRGLELGGFTVSGKIDRIDVDLYSARGIVQDYKSGEAFSAQKIDADARLQIPLYILVLRDLVGLEPLGGLYRSLSGEREARGLLRAEARAELPSLQGRDFLDEDEFWARVERAADRAREAVRRIRAGDVRHDPREGSCPSWCADWPMCRIERS
jgi:ATP-dependent helicase/DNAse subunit B